MPYIAQEYRPEIDEILQAFIKKSTFSRSPSALGHVVVLLAHSVAPAYKNYKSLIGEVLEAMCEHSRRDYPLSSVPGYEILSPVKGEDPVIEETASSLLAVPNILEGKLNYFISALLLWLTAYRDNKYIEDALGGLTAAVDYTRGVCLARYEDIKIREHGDLNLMSIFNTAPISQSGTIKPIDSTGVQHMFGVYVAIPYTHPNANLRNYRYHLSTLYTANLFSSGRTAFSPITHSHPMSEFGCPTNFEFYRDFDHKMVDLCEEFHVILAPGWERSVGVRAEYEWAKRGNKKIFVVDPQTLMASPLTKELVFE